ncbi:hypothetical protein B0H14DRAFT_3531592 [Mycena olivaceomarginata]|nr:hypothetical protein B0H14DRAFT_3531592 [Mycena olivaceomarginata]
MVSALPFLTPCNALCSGEVSGSSSHAGDGGQRQVICTPKKRGFASPPPPLKPLAPTRLPDLFCVGSLRFVPKNPRQVMEPSTPAQKARPELMFTPEDAARSRAGDSSPELSGYSSNILDTSQDLANHGQLFQHAGQLPGDADNSPSFPDGADLVNSYFAGPLPGDETPLSMPGIATLNNHRYDSESEEDELASPQSRQPRVSPSPFIPKRPLQDRLVGASYAPHQRAFEPEPEPELEEGEIMDDQVGGGYELRHNITPFAMPRPSQSACRNAGRTLPPNPSHPRRGPTKKKNKGVGLPVGFKLLGPRSPPAPAPPAPAPRQCPRHRPLFTDSVPAPAPPSRLSGLRPPSSPPLPARLPVRRRHISLPRSPSPLSPPPPVRRRRILLPRPSAQLAKPATARAPTPHLPPVPAQPAQPAQGFLSGTIHLAAQPDTAPRVDAASPSRARCSCRRRPTVHLGAEPIPPQLFCGGTLEQYRSSVGFKHIPLPPPLPGWSELHTRIDEKAAPDSENEKAAPDFGKLYHINADPDADNNEEPDFGAAELDEVNADPDADEEQQLCDPDAVGAADDETDPAPAYEVLAAGKKQKRKFGAGPPGRPSSQVVSVLDDHFEQVRAVLSDCAATSGLPYDVVLKRFYKRELRATRSANDWNRYQRFANYSDQNRLPPHHIGGGACPLPAVTAQLGNAKAVEVLEAFFDADGFSDDTIRGRDRRFDAACLTFQKLIDRYKLDDFFIKMIIGGGHANEDAKLGRVLETAGIEGVLEAELDVAEDDLIAFVKIRASAAIISEQSRLRRESKKAASGSASMSHTPAASTSHAPAASTSRAPAASTSRAPAASTSRGPAASTAHAPAASTPQSATPAGNNQPKPPISDGGADWTEYGDDTKDINAVRALMSRASREDLPDAEGGEGLDIFRDWCKNGFSWTVIAAELYSHGIWIRNFPDDVEQPTLARPSKASGGWTRHERRSLRAASPGAFVTGRGDPVRAPSVQRQRHVHSYLVTLSTNFFPAAFVIVSHDYTKPVPLDPAEAVRFWRSSDTAVHCSAGDTTCWMTTYDIDVPSTLARPAQPSDGKEVAPTHGERKKDKRRRPPTGEGVATPSPPKKPRVADDYQTEEDAGSEEIPQRHRAPARDGRSKKAKPKAREEEQEEEARGGGGRDETPAPKKRRRDAAEEQVGGGILRTTGGGGGTLKQVKVVSPPQPHRPLPLYIDESGEEVTSDYDFDDLPLARLPQKKQRRSTYSSSDEDTPAPSPRVTRATSKAKVGPPQNAPKSQRARSQKEPVREPVRMQLDYPAHTDADARLPVKALHGASRVLFGSRVSSAPPVALSSGRAGGFLVRQPAVPAPPPPHPRAPAKPAPPRPATRPPPQRGPPPLPPQPGPSPPSPSSPPGPPLAAQPAVAAQPAAFMLGSRQPGA